MVTENKIDWARLGRAVEFYQGFGFKYVETPWIVDQKYVNITRPEGGTAFRVNSDGGEDYGGYLVASAEQGLLASTRGNHKLCSVSPCFRNDKEDDIHQKWFMKVELFHSSNIKPSEDYLNQVIGMARHFFFLEGVTTRKERAPQTDRLAVVDNLDLVDDVTGIELGSYGIRKHAETGYWVYATGVAEPRFSYVKGLREVGAKFT